MVPERDLTPQPIGGDDSLLPVSLEDSRERQANRLRVFWDRRRLFLQMTVIGLVVSTLIAFLIPKSYTSTTQLMPPDTQSSSGMAMMAAFAAKGSNGLGSMAGDLLGLKTTGALFVGVLRSQTSEDRVIERFDLRKVYGKRLVADARAKLDENTSITEDRKSGIITISVTDRSPQRAAGLANAYVDELNSLVTDLSTSAAHRQRVFLEERLKVVKEDLDDASNQLAQFSSRNNTLDIEQEGKAMLDVAATIAGQMVAAQAQLEGLRRIYTDNNPRVQALSARVDELRKQLQRLGGVNSKSGEGHDTIQTSSSDMPYPSIKNLPLLGVKYADYYQRAKIQGTVYELLTQQYELAKVEEAKETPSVKVLDPGTVPEKKSFPPRLSIMLMGAFLGFALTVIWVLGATRWNEVDPQDPRKILVREISETLKGRVPWASENGDGPRWATHKVWDRLTHRQSTGYNANTSKQL
ncbi:MAG TPA: Wzz/FepE/Etk N-terminal domain-containing protein [Candidatus Sulfotelmatobacter sp.]|nr:Wzz/FepE/Etk N-terminal domain-containing protein [Candidatus Sulfotelmatobacter sp.]